MRAATRNERGGIFLILVFWLLFLPRHLRFMNTIEKKHKQLNKKSDWKL
jgi:hypothetical protein